MSHLRLLALRNTETVTVVKRVEQTGPGGRLVQGDGDSYEVVGAFIPIRNTALDRGYSAGAYEGEMAKVIFTRENLAKAGLGKIDASDRLIRSTGERFTVEKTETWDRLGLVVVYGTKEVR